jgi:hypothetical protein
MKAKTIGDVTSLRKTIKSVSLLDVYQNTSKWSQEYRDKSQEKYEVIDKCDTSVYVPWPEDPMATFIPKEHSYLVQIPCNLIRSCPTYNRTSHINFKDCSSHLDYAGGAFIHKGSEPITVFYDRKNGGILRTTRGNHRILMKFLVEGENATIWGRIIPHDVSVSNEDMILTEAENFDQDNQFTGMDKHMKFKGQLFHEFTGAVEEKDMWARPLYDFLDECNPSIGVSDTNENAKVNIDGFGAIKSMKTEHREEGSIEPDLFLRDILETQCRFAFNGSGKGTINATLTRALCKFKKIFGKVFKDVDAANECNSWNLWMNYMFNERNSLHTHPKIRNLTQEELTKGNSQVRIPEYFVAILATLYNEFVAIKGYDPGDGRKKTKEGDDSDVITSSSVPFLELLNGVPQHFRSMVRDRCSYMYNGTRA